MKEEEQQQQQNPKFKHIKYIQSPSCLIKNHSLCTKQTDGEFFVCCFCRTADTIWPRENACHIIIEWKNNDSLTNLRWFFDQQLTDKQKKNQIANATKLEMENLTKETRAICQSSASGYSFHMSRMNLSPEHLRVHFAGDGIK